MFKPGDEVVCVNDASWSPDTFQPLKGHVYTVSEVVLDCGRIGIVLCEANNADDLFDPTHFRKVQKRNDRLSIESFMTMPGGFEEPRRPAKTKEKKDA